MDGARRGRAVAQPAGFTAGVSAGHDASGAHNAAQAAECTPDPALSVTKIVELYCDTARLATGGMFGYHTVSVSDRWNGAAQYELILLTSHRDGLWYFGEAISGAVEKFYAWCNPSQQTMDDPTLRAQEWTDDIAANLETLLREEGTFTVIQHADRVYGNTLGLARGKHVRAAVKKPHREGKTSTTGVGGRPEDLVVER